MPRKTALFVVDFIAQHFYGVSDKDLQSLIRERFLHAVERLHAALFDTRGDLPLEFIGWRALLARVGEEPAVFKARLF